MIAHLDRHRRARRRPDLALQPRRPARHARPAHAGLPPPAAALAGVLHAHAHRRDPVAHRQRHRRRAERRHHHRDLDRLQRDDGHRDASSRCSCSTGGWRCSRSRCCRSSCCWPRRVGERRRSDHRDQAGRDGRHLLARAGVAVGLGHPARQDDGPQRRAGRPLRGRVGEPRRPRGPLAHGRPLDDGLDPDDVRGHAGARLPVRRASRPNAVSIGTARRLHHAADAALLPDPVAAQRRRRHPDLDGAVRPRLRVPRPAGRHPAGHARRCTTVARRGARSTTSGSATSRGAPGRCQLDAAGHRPAMSRPGTRTALVGETGLGQDDARLPRRAPLRPRARARCGSTASTCAT